MDSKKNTELHKSDKTAVKIIAVIMLCAVLLLITACSDNSSKAVEQEDTIFTSYLEIPGITEREIAAINALRNENRSFVYAMPLSTEAFINDDGNIDGYAALLCDWLSELFDIPFEPTIQSLAVVLENLSTGDTDFSTLVVTPERQQTLFVTAPIVHRSMKIMQLDDAPAMSAIAMSRPVRYVIIEGAGMMDQAIASLEPGTFELLVAENHEVVFNMLQNGEADAFIGINTAEAAFDPFGGVVVHDFFPLLVLPVALVAENPSLEPIISAVTKAVENGAYTHLTELYLQGYQSYIKNKFMSLLTDEEKEFIQNSPTIPFASQHYNYPLSFFNRRELEWQGASFDILREVEFLTGLSFELISNEYTTLTEMMELLESGKAHFSSDLIITPERAQRFAWADTVFLTDQLAVLSKGSYPNVELNDIPFRRVGVAKNSSFSEFFHNFFPNALYVSEYSTTEEMFAALDLGEIDLIMSGRYRLSSRANFYELSDNKVNYLFDAEYESTFGFNREQEILRSIFSKALRFIPTDRIMEQWISQTYNFEAMRMRDQMPWLIGSITLATIVLILITILFIYSSVKNKNMEVQAKIIDEARGSLQSLLDMLPVGVLIQRVDDLKLVYANQSCLDVYNCETFSELSEGFDNFKFFPEYQSDGRTTQEIFENIFIQNKATTELNCLKATGETFINRMMSRQIKYSGYNVLMTVIEDITAEEEYERMLKDIAIREQEANQLKTRFLANMSHEIRTPINAIMGMTELALRGDSPNAIKEHVFTAKQAASNLLVIINDILDYSKIEAGKLEIITKEYSVASLLHDVVSIIRMRILDSDSNISFAVKADSSIPHILYGDETRIRQAVLNLLNNAVKYTEEGHILFSVYGEIIGNNKVDIIFEVTDTGIGIKQEDLDIMFEDFTQFDLERNRGVEGVGLGLAITNNIVNEMGGVISVKSEYGTGSIFTIRLPQKYKSKNILAKVEKPLEKSVLFYERNKVYVDSLIWTFDNLGVSCTHVGSGTDLYEKMESGSYNYIFITFELFRKNEETIRKFGENTKIVVLTKFGEVISEENINIISIPVYCTAVADILNGVQGRFSYCDKNEHIVRFSAPTAKILVVDDIKTNLDVTKGLLAPFKMHVDLRGNGAAAIEAVKKEQYDLILMDHKMPVMDGIEAVRHIRNMGKKVPIIALTANAMSGMREMFLESGFNDFLSKPIDTVKLSNILERWIPKEKQKK